MLQKLNNYISNLNLIKSGDRLLVALSGGIDSMVLSHLLISSKIEFTCAHVNYQLRGKESDLDEKFVITWAKKNGVQLFTKKINCSEYATDKGLSIQMAARNLRYIWFKELCKEHGFTHIVTAHHADDNLETALFNITKGTGIRGVRGILPRTEDRIRPLLLFGKTTISQYAIANNIKWREDETNNELKYNRNKIRHQVIPVLREINPSVVENFSFSQERLIGVEQLLTEKSSEISSEYLRQYEGYYELSLSWTTDALKDQIILHEILKDFGVQYAQLRQVFEATLNAHSGSIFHTATHEFNLDRGKIIIKPKTVQGNNEIVIGPLESLVQFENFSLHLDISLITNVYISKSSEYACLDLKTIQFPLIVRSWKEGDYFYPLGMQHRKKISDFLIDQKIPRLLKNEVKVIESAGEICWIIGFRIDDRYKITPKTEEVLILRKEENHV